MSPGNRLEKLKGDRGGQYGIRINDDQWRICFKWSGNKAEGVEVLWVITHVRKMMDKTLSPIHRGEILLEDFMKPLGLSQYRLTHDIGVTPIRISQIVNGERSITVDTAMRLARYFGTSAAVWLRLQVRYDL